MENLIIDIGISDIITIATAVTSIVLIFLGLNGDISNKKSQLLFVMSSYVVIYVFYLFLIKDYYLLLVFVGIIMFGGVGYLSQLGNLDLERELSISHLLRYSIQALFYLTFGFYQPICVVLVIFFSKQKDLSLMIFLFFVTIQYIIVAKDFFSFKNFDKTITEKWAPNITKNISPKEILDIKKEMTLEDFEILAFIVFSEDKDFFNRKKSHISLGELLKKILKRVQNVCRLYKSIFKKLIKKENDICDEKKEYEKNNSSVSFLFRGYSTIESQVIRQYAMEEFSYRFKLRRKLFIERVYTSYLILSLKKRKSRLFSRSYFERLRIQKSMKIPMKFSILMCYYNHVLGKPESMSDLKKQLVKQSRLKKEDIDFKYNSFEESQLKNEILQNINSAFDSEIWF